MVSSPRTASTVLAATLLAATTLTACGGKIKTRPIDRPTDPVFSVATRQVLEEEQVHAGDDPGHAIVELERIASENASPALDVAIAEVAFEAGERALRRGEPAAGWFLCAAYRASRQVDDPAAIELYDASVAHVLAALEAQGWARPPIEIEGPVRGYALRLDGAEAERWTPESYEWTPADLLEVHGLLEVVRRDGVGAPIVAQRRELERRTPSEDGWNPTYDRFYALTVTLRFDATALDTQQRVTIAAHDPLVTDTVEVGGKPVPLAFDLSAMLATLIEEVDPEASGESGMFRSARHLDYAGLYLMEPYRTDKIPIIFVHGLAATAGTFAQIVNTLRGDPVIRSRYQFWLYQYPSGLPAIYAEHMLRTALDQTLFDLDPEGANRDLDRTVVIGHSLGGLLARMLVSDSGTTLWDTVFTKPIDELDLDADERDYLERTMFFERVEDVDRVIFLATPHRGAPMATSMIGKIGNALVKLPPELTETSRSILAKNSESLTPVFADIQQAKGSIRSLAEGGPFLEALAQIPIDPSVPYHSIMGDKGSGKGEESTDGVVPYWSSHLDGAESELIVPKNHIVHDHPACIEKVRRILLEHLEKENS